MSGMLVYVYACVLCVCVCVCVCHRVWGLGGGVGCKHVFVDGLQVFVDSVIC